MSEYGYTQAGSESLQNYILKVFTKMSTGLSLTAVIAFLGYRSLASGGAMASFFYRMPMMSLGILVVQLILCVLLTAKLATMSTAMAETMFYVYAVLTGVTFSVLPYVYGAGNVFAAFIYTAVMFVCCTIIGHTTRTDMTRFSGIFMGGLIALIVCTVLSFFIPVLRDNIVINYLAVFLFMGLTVYDMQRIKQFYYGTVPGQQIRENLAVFGAFELYLDFLNLFLRILQIMSRSRRR
ncbi:MAG: Bax inhibitor-1/YccA family protein [Solobacterium sp.]|nr:Bax inhibitor-1/YccA family protein [Erysipelotrichaceae bacterium]MBQ1324446.1 Bax inhibitor-1/YccA family protein [Solobacterium sp.]MBQ1447224.1 Bax inhibitor-1/YccA family protein [Solobacterium sp.]MBR2727986.1 Bax inhibitor-1/YccA family protein [Solobacterium sp.]